MSFILLIHSLYVSSTFYYLNDSHNLGIGTKIHIIFFLLQDLITTFSNFFFKVENPMFFKASKRILPFLDLLSRQLGVILLQSYL